MSIFPLCFLLSTQGYISIDLLCQLYIYKGLNRCYKNLTHLINFLDEAKVKLHKLEVQLPLTLRNIHACMTINGLDSCSPVHYQIEERETGLSIICRTISSFCKISDMPSTPKIISTINSTIDPLLRDTRGSKLFSSGNLVQLIYKGMLYILILYFQGFPIIYSQGFCICLFIWGLSSHSRIFHSYEDVTITGEGLQILTYAQHSWPLSSEGFLACHTLCDMGHTFIMVISKGL